MKELSIEEKAKRYDEAIEKAKGVIEQNPLMEYLNKGIEYIFPELAESDGERIRKALLTKFANEKKQGGKYEIHGVSIDNIIAWLEKQGESTDKVEPKFKVGDWVVVSTSDVEKVVQIDSIEYFKSGEPKYITSEGRWFGSETKARLWNIADAKDGDMLSYRDGQWIFIYKEKIDDSSFCYHALYSTIHQDLTINDAGFTLLDDAIVPATKEQRVLLFQKIKEAGYEWDAEKKNLKKIVYNGEHKLLTVKQARKMSPFMMSGFEQKPAWSDDDEVKINRIVACLENLNVADNDILLKDVAWLKSFRPQNHWKPSDEQMEALNAINVTGCISYSGQGQKLINLYNDLKKLK